MSLESISFEYLLKVRQMTWEDAELIDHLFGPVAAEEKSDVRNETDRDSYEDASKYIHDILETKQDRQPDVDEATKGLFLYLDYNKVINVRVLLSYLHNDEYVNTFSSSSDFCREPPTPSDNASSSMDGLMNVSSPPERSREDIQNTMCTVCHKTFARKSNLTVHLRTHTGEKPFSCPQCEKKFARKEHLKHHLLVHSGVKEYLCDICHHTFARKDTLNDHRRSHTGVKPFVCTECNARFSDRGGLNRHMRTHTGETPYQCEICGKNFNRISNLKTHLLVHSEKKPFACTYENCGKKFTQLCNLKTHLLTHSKEKPFACTYTNCNKNFRKKHHLLRHTCTHIG